MISIEISYLPGSLELLVGLSPDYLLGLMILLQHKRLSNVGAILKFYRAYVNTSRYVQVRYENNLSPQRMPCLKRLFNKLI
jgi:hypothetical protein